MKQSPKRSQHKKITLKARTIRYMRIIRGISQREASRRCGLSESAIGHYEQGRMDISPERLAEFLKCYGIDLTEFEEFANGIRPIPAISMRDECITLLGRMDENKLKAVHAMLTNFIY